MIPKKHFIDLIKSQLEFDKQVDKIDDALDCNFFESSVVEHASFLFNTCLNLIFTKEGIDDIYWWMYEKNSRQDYKMWDKEGNEIPTETLDDLWEIVKSEQKNA